LQEKICNSFGYTRRKHFQSHFAFVDQLFFLFTKFRQKEEKKRKKEREKGMKCFFDGWFSIHKSFKFKKKKRGKDGHISIFNFQQKSHKYTKDD
jgi:hypothetical protein